MREETVKFCELMTARVNGKPHGDEDKPKQLTHRTIAYLRKNIDRFTQMNIFGDADVEKMLKEFKDQFLDMGTAPKDFEHDNVKKSVTAALGAIHKKASEAGDANQVQRKVVI
jgi:hypothetical protein